MAQRETRRLITLSALVVVGFVVSTGLAMALGAFGGEAGDPSADPSATKRVAVASGDAPGIGKWTLWYSKTADGDKCVEIQFVDPAEEQVPAGRRVSGSVPVPGEGSLAGGCGQSATLTADTLNAPERTLVYGIAPGGAATIAVEGRGRSANARTYSPPGLDIKAYAHSLARSDAGDLRVSARGRDGREIAAARAVTPESTR